MRNNKQNIENSPNSTQQIANSITNIFVDESEKSILEKIELKNSLFESVKEINRLLIDNFQINEAIYNINKLFSLFDLFSNKEKVIVLTEKGNLELKKGDLKSAEEILEKIILIDKNLFNDKDALKFALDISIKNNLCEKFEQYNNQMSFLLSSAEKDYKYEIRIKKLFFENKDEELIKYVEENNLLQDYSNNYSFYFFYGISLIRRQEYAKGKSILIQSLNIKKIYTVEYWILLSEVLPILNLPHIEFSVNEIQINILRDSYLKLNNLQKIFNEYTEDIQNDFYDLKVVLMYIINYDDYKKEIDNIPKSIYNNNYRIQLFHSKLLVKKENYSEAEDILNNLFVKSKSLDNLIDLVILKIVEMKYNESQDIIKKNKYLFKEDTRGRLFTLYLEVLNKTKGICYVEKLILKYQNLDKELFNKKPLILVVYLQLLCSENRIINIHNYLKDVNNLIQNNDFSRLILSEKLKVVKLFPEAISIITPYIQIFPDYEYKLLEIYLFAYLNTKDKQFLIDAHERIDQKNISQLDNNLLAIACDIYFNLANYQKCFYFSNELFKKEKSINAAYNIVISALNIKDKDLIEEDIINYLKIQKNYLAFIALSNYYHFNGDSITSIKYYFKSFFYLQNDDLLENILYNYWQLLLNNEINIPHKKFDKVLEDVVVILKNINSNDIVYYCLNSDIEFPQRNNIKIGNIIFINKTDIIYTQILYSKINDRVKIKNIDYEIINIIDKYNYFARYYLENFVNEETSKIFTIKINPNNPIETMIPFLQKRKEAIDSVIKIYDIKRGNNNLGISIKMFSTYLGINYFQSLFSIFYNKEIIYYSGEVNNISINSKIVLSLSTLLLLSILDSLDVIKNNFNILITKELFNYIHYEFENYYKNEDKKEGFIGINDNGMIYFDNKNEDSILNVQSIWKKIYTFICDLNKFCIIEINKLDYAFSDHIGSLDYNSIVLAKESNAIIICDDLFVRKVSNDVLNYFEHSNTSSLLFVIYKTDENQLLDKLMILAKNKYLYCINTYKLLELINIIIEKNKIIGVGTIYDKFENFINLLLNEKYLFNIYYGIISDTIINLIKSENYILYDKIIKILVKVLLVNMKSYKIDIYKYLLYFRIRFNKYEFFKYLILEKYFINNAPSVAPDFNY